MKDLKVNIASETYEAYQAAKRKIRIERAVVITLSVITGAMKAEIDYRCYYNCNTDGDNISPMPLLIAEAVSTGVRMLTNSFMTLQAIILISYFINQRLKRIRGKGYLTRFNKFIIVFIFIVLIQRFLSHIGMNILLIIRILGRQPHGLYYQINRLLVLPLRDFAELSLICYMLRS